MGDHESIVDSMRCKIRISNFVLQIRELGSQNLNSLVPLESHVFSTAVHVPRYMKLLVRAEVQLSRTAVVS